MHVVIVVAVCVARNDAPVRPQVRDVVLTPLMRSLIVVCSLCCIFFKVALRQPNRGVEPSSVNYRVIFSSLTDNISLVCVKCVVLPTLICFQLRREKPNSACCFLFCFFFLKVKEASCAFVINT